MSGEARPWDAHHRFIAAAAAAAVAYFLLGSRLHQAGRLLVTWDVFALTMVALAGMVILRRDPYEARLHARLQDSSRSFLFALVLTAAVASLLAAAWTLRSSRGASGESKAGHLILALAAVAISWLLVHTVFTLRYAHQYYRDAQTTPRDKVEGGLIFPGKSLPDYLDFAYFSFVVGMTCQVSDVQVASRSLRHDVLVHGIISFAFNTAILAVFINIVAGML